MNEARRIFMLAIMNTEFILFYNNMNAKIQPHTHSHNDDGELKLPEASL